tara:strand:- start:306 stop:1034 length:729 start_codon:yes stop_codon:yes gene_type:complete
MKGPLKRKIDEIPFAERTIPIRSFSSANAPLIFFYRLFISFSLGSLIFILIFSNIFPEIRKKLSLDSSSKYSLLGHLPYPEAADESLVDIYPGLKVHQDMYETLMEMREAAALDGVELVFLSGFRSIDLQRDIFYENKSRRKQTAIERAKVSAPPGYSEHSTGYAIDIGDRTMRQTDFESTFEFTPAFRWLKENATKYHFVLSFPKENFQGVSYEPWHWRFEGTVEALKKFEESNRKRREAQ